MSDGPSSREVVGEQLRYLTDDQLRQGIESMYFAYRGFVSDPDAILAEFGYGRAHHRAIHFIGHRESLNVSQLIAILGISKQSLNRVLSQLKEDSIVEVRVDPKDRRARLLCLTMEGQKLAGKLFHAQQSRMRAAYRSAGPEAVAGFRLVLENIMDPPHRSGLSGPAARDQQ